MLTILIPTHAVKKELIGPYKDVPQHNATAPSTRLIEYIMSTVNQHLDVEKTFLIGLDHKSDVEVSNQYLQNLQSLSEKHDDVNVTHVSHASDEKILTTQSATENFYNLINNSPTEYFLLWEHDWIFTSPADTKQVKIWDNDIEMLRFNQFTNTQEDHGCTNKLWEDETGLRTDRFSNNPFITSKTIWNKKYRPLADNIPDWWGINPIDGLDYGAFIEGPICRHLDSNPDELEYYKINLYGEHGDTPIIGHLNGQIWR